MFDKPWKIAVASVLLSVVVGLFVWKMTDRERHMTELMEQLSAEVTQEFAQKLPRQREINRMLLLVVERAPRPEEAELRDKLVDRIIASDKYTLVTWGKVEDVLSDQINKWYAKFGLLPGSRPVTIEQAVDAMKKLDRANFEIDGVLFVEITQFFEGESEDGFGAKLGVKGTIWSRQLQKEVASVGPVQRAIDSRLDLRYLSHAMGTQSLLWRIPVWLLVACALPWLLIGLVRFVLKRRSNGMTFGLLGAFVAVDVALAWVLLSSFGTGGLAMFGLLLIAAMMAYYNYDAIDYIQRRLL